MLRKFAASVCRLAHPAPQHVFPSVQGVFPLLAHTQAWPTQCGAADVVQSLSAQHTPLKQDPLQQTLPLSHFLLLLHATQVLPPQIGVGFAQTRPHPPQCAGLYTTATHPVAQHQVSPVQGAFPLLVQVQEWSTQSGAVGPEQPPIPLQQTAPLPHWLLLVHALQTLSVQMEVGLAQVAQLPPALPQAALVVPSWHTPEPSQHPGHATHCPPLQIVQAGHAVTQVSPSQQPSHPVQTPASQVAQAGQELAVQAQAPSLAQTCPALRQGWPACFGSGTQVRVMALQVKHGLHGVGQSHEPQLTALLQVCTFVTAPHFPAQTVLVGWGLHFFFFFFFFFFSGPTWWRSRFSCLPCFRCRRFFASTSSSSRRPSSPPATGRVARKPSTPRREPADAIDRATRSRSMVSNPHGSNGLARHRRRPRATLAVPWTSVTRHLRGKMPGWMRTQRTVMSAVSGFPPVAAGSPQAQQAPPLWHFGTSPRQFSRQLPTTIGEGDDPSRATWPPST